MPGRDLINVLFIAGAGRSGSTLLDRMLGQIPGVHAVGELKFIWDRGLLENQLCGCSKPLNECAYWNAILEAAFGSVDAINKQDLWELRQAVERIRHAHRLAFPVLQTRQNKQHLQAYADVLGNIYRGIQETTNATLIVDSSKDATHGFVLNQVNNIDLHVLHLTRDSRAVAHSWTREKLRPEVQKERTYFLTRSVYDSASRWILLNWLANRLQKTSTHYAHFRYEDIVSHPQENLRNIIKFTGEPSLLALIDDLFDGNIMTFKATHTVAGNPGRFKVGPMPIRLDDEWKNSMPAGRKRMTTLLTAPLLRRYGYLGNHNE